VRYCTSFGGGRREDAKKVSGTSKPDFKIAAMGELKDEDEVQSSQVRDYATTTGGAIFYASKSNTMPDLYSRIMEQARHDYTIAYAPTGNIKNANCHTVKVTATCRLTASTRSGYYTSDSGTLHQ
jgi:hypothetical protein